LALGAGVPYFWWLFGKVWWMRPEFEYIASLVALASICTVGVVGALTALLVPRNRWLYPLVFAALPLGFGVGALAEPRAAIFWVALGGATFGVGLGCSYVVSAFRSRRLAP